MANHVRNGASLKYELCRHSSAVARFFGSYMNRKFNRRKPAAESQGNRVFKLLYGWCLRVKFFNAGKVEYSGQIASDGVPNSLMISSSWAISVVPGNNGLWPSNSPKIQPTAHMSMAVVWTGEPSRSSGARYHRVTTCGVIGLGGIPKYRAKPKSAGTTQ